MTQSDLPKNLLMWIGFTHFWRIGLMFIFLNICLVGSCRTGDLQKAFAAENSTEIIRLAALNPTAGVGSFAQNRSLSSSVGYLNTIKEYISNAPEILLKLTQNQIGLIFGEPILVRQDAQAKVLQYQKGSCVLDLYFYQNTTTGDVPMTHYELREQFEPFATSQTESTPQDCLKDLLNRPLKTPPETV